MTKERLVASTALLVAAAAIGVQIAGGADYPRVPPGPIVLVAAALVCAFWRRWFSPLIAAVLVAFLFVGAIVAPNTSDNLGEPTGSAVFLGTVGQLAAMAVGLAAAILTSVRDRRAARTPPAGPGRARRA